ncbi:MAG TPA: hypothetical protein VMW69_12655, partial [Spirochaetia bacterium]|nr:hypothetical protein [Spirochaetia bacterium]
QIPLPGGPEDLSGAQSISFEVNSALAGTGVTAYLQIGSIGEDLDANGVLDSSTSTSDKSFSFDDNGTLLTTTGGASPTSGGTYASEDTNGNGILDLENSNLVVTKTITLPTTPGWSKIQIELTPSERARLANANSLRIVLVDSAGTDVASTLEVSDLSISRAPFAFSASAPDTTVVREVSDPQASGKQLEDLYPEVKTIFHSTGSPQKVLEVNWSGASGASAPPAWTLTGYPNPAPAGVYKKLEFYLLGKAITPSTGPTISLNLTDQGQTGIHLLLPVPGDDVWHKYSIDLSSGAVTIDGASTTLSATIGTGVSRYTTLTIASSGATDGDVFIDEIHLSGAMVGLSAGISFDGSYTHTGPVASIGGLTLLKDVSVTESASASGPSFASGFESYPDSTSVSSFTQAQAGLPFGRLGIQFGVVRTASQTVLSGGHTLQVPIGPVSLSDSYSQTVEGGQVTLSRSDGVGLALNSALNATIQDSSSAIGPNLTQTIQATASSSPASAISLSANASLGNQVGSYSPASLLYFTNWIDSYGLLAPVPEADATRSGSFNADGQFSLRGAAENPSVRLDLHPSASYQSAFTTSRFQTNLGGFTLSLPIFSGQSTHRGFTLTPAYTRSFSTSLETPSNTAYSGDLQSYGTALAGARYLFDSLPFAELFSTATLQEFEAASAGLTTASYVPGVSLALTRPSGSYLRDLFLPTNFVVTLDRTLERSSDTVTDSLGWEAQYGTDALNLFGSAGVLPIFRFYRTEEIATNLDVKSTADGVASVVQNLITLYFADQQQLQLDHRLDLAWTPDLAISDHATLSFSYRPSLKITLPYVPKDFQAGSYLENTESANFQTSPDITYNSFQINLDHETAIVLPDHGKITASAGFGVGENRISAGERRILFGIQASVGAQLAF